jgi:hypothetical protein
MHDVETDRLGGFADFRVGRVPLPFVSHVLRKLSFRHKGFARIPRVWSNAELRRIGPLLSGSVLNCSGWCDEDKGGGFYRDYFPDATDYHVSMPELRAYRGDRPGVERRPDVLIDLEAGIADRGLDGRYDVVFSHTVLEHVFDFFAAFRVLCQLSRDAVVVVVPWCQRVHESTDANDTYFDFWRFSPRAIQRLFDQNGLAMIYLNGNEHRHSSTYYLSVGSRCPERHQDIATLNPAIVPDGSAIYW